MSSFNYSVHFLRFIAISGVFIYHLFPSALIGAFAGVDVFFVVSGFVITLTIIKDYETNTFSFVKFYSRRIRRIFPALIFTIALVLIALLLMYPTSHVVNFSKTAKHGATQISNLYFINVRSDYFAIKLDNIMDPTLHTWSLGVEE